MCRTSLPQMFGWHVLFQRVYTANFEAKSAAAHHASDGCQYRRLLSAPPRRSARDQQIVHLDPEPTKCMGSTLVMQKYRA